MTDPRLFETKRAAKLLLNGATPLFIASQEEHVEAAMWPVVVLYQWWGCWSIRASKMFIEKN